MICSLSVAIWGLAPAAETTAPRDAGPAPEVRALLGDRAVSILRGATRVEVFRLDPNLAGAPAGEGRPRVDGYSVRATAPERDARFAARVATVLLDRRTYEFERPKGCIIRPGVAFRLWKGKESVDLILCFECEILGVVARDEEGKEVRRAFKDFDPGRAALVRLAREALPDDREIQALR